MTDPQAPDYKNAIAAYQALFKFCPLAILTVNTEYLVVDWNIGAEAMFGWTREEALGKPPLFIPQVCIPFFEENFARALGGEIIDNLEVERVRKDGTMIPLSIWAVPNYAGSEITGATVIIADISVKRQHERDMGQARAKAEDANRAKSDFLANMSHEIRTPLGCVVGFSEMLSDPNITKEDRLNYMSVIRRNSKHLTHLIDDILDLSKVESSAFEVETLTFSLPDLLSEIHESLAPLARKKDLSFMLTLPDDAPEYVRSDPVRLKQILVNMLGNALKFTLGGSVTWWLALEGDDKSTLVFHVSDTGIGIEPAHIPRLFQPFSQADTTHTRKFGGTGLGLVLSRKLARALGGDVTLAATAPAQGSTFEVRVKVGLPQDRPRATTLGLSSEEINLAGVKILLVEDSADNRQLIEMFLRPSGCTVQTATNGEEAVTAALDGDFDLILMDVQMPIMDGYEATEKLRQLGFKKPIVVLTAHAMSEHQERAFARGCTAYLSKPVDRAGLVKTIKRVYDSARARPSAV